MPTPDTNARLQASCCCIFWFDGETTMQMDLDIALHRPDVGHVDLIDCKKFTTTRLYP